MRRGRALASRLLGLYAPGDWLVLVLAGVLAYWSYTEAKATAAVADPPAPPEMAIIATLPTSSRALVDYDVSGFVVLRHGCSNPARVTLDFRTAAPPRHSVRAFSQTYSIAFALVNVQGRNYHVVSQQLTDAGVREPVPVRSSARSEGFLPTPPTFSEHGTVVRAKLPADPSASEGRIFSLRFNADWISRRGYRSCYVSMPDLAGVRLVRAQDLATQRFGFSNPAATAAVSVQPASGGSVQPFLSIPPPSNLREETWYCKRNAPSCEATAVFYEPNSEGASSTRIFVFGALLGLLLALVVDSARRIRNPWSRRTAPH